MKRKIPRLVLAAVLFFSLALSAFADVYLIPVKGDIDLGVAGFVKRVIREAERYKADLVIIENDTLGGRIDAALEIRDSIINAKVPTATFISGRAWSAGALIALAGDELYMVPGSSIGSAETIPKDEKTISAVRREFKATAEARGKNGRIAEAMVDSDVEIPDLSPKGKILNLTAREAVNHDIADGVVASFDELIQVKSLVYEDIVAKQPSRVENLVRFLTDPVVSTLLLTIGFLGIIFEFFTQGWGAAGTVGLLSLTLFFGGRYLTGLAGLENVVLFIVGVILMALELLVIPGFGIVGILGILGILTSIILSFENYTQAVWVLIASFAFTALAVKLLWKKLRKSPIMKKIILESALDEERGFTIASPEVKSLVGKTGTTSTVMRPSGLVEIEGQRYTAQTPGDFLEKGTKIRVIEVRANRIVVEKVPEND